MGKRKRRNRSDGPSLEAAVGVTVAETFGYLAVEGVMNDNQHPIHWVLTFAMAGVGYAIDKLVYWWRDVRV